jgi:cytochrome c-type biogenesis protein CcmE
MHRYLKFGIPIGAAWVIFVWLGLRSTPQTSEYLVEIPELKKMDQQIREKRLLVIGYVKEGSILSAGRTTTFLLVEHGSKAAQQSGDGEQLKVVFTGSDLPDTFREEAQAVAYGKMGPGGVFRANKIQAKSAGW